MPDWVPLNGNLMRHWQNWFIILLMLLIAGFALDLLLRGFGVQQMKRAA